MAIGNSHHPPPHSAFHVEKPTSDSVSNIRIDDGASLGTLGGARCLSAWLSKAMPLGVPARLDTSRFTFPSGDSSPGDSRKFIKD